MNLRTVVASALALAVLSLDSCDAQNDPSYGGEAAGHGRGTITSEVDLRPRSSPA